VTTLPEPAEMIRRLVAVRSVSSPDPAIDAPNTGVLDALAAWAEGLGFAIDVRPVDGAGRKKNLVATLGRGEPGLVLAGHSDTVPTEERRWSSDPFVATERHGKIFGLGTADMKSFLALALAAAARFRGDALRAPLVLLATADEESTMSGARALVAAGEKLGPRAIIGEPTSLRPVRMHKGVFFDTLRLRGRSGHSSNPALGRSALEGMHAAIGAILAYRDELARTHRNDAFEVPVPTINLGRIAGGDAPNRICADCELAFDMRLLPGMDPMTERARLRERIEAAVAGRGLDVELEPSFDGVPPFLTPADADVVRAAEELTGAPSGVVGFATEGPFLAALGTPAVILGPGSIDVAHQPDEFLPVAAIQPTIEILSRAIARFCT
jgi:acetylornithine deacetylase